MKQGIPLPNYFSLTAILATTLVIFPAICFFILIKQPLSALKMKSQSTIQEKIDHEKLKRNKILLDQDIQKLNQIKLVSHQKYKHLNHALNNIVLSQRLMALAKNCALKITVFHPIDSNQDKEFVIRCKGNYQSLLTFIQMLGFSSLPIRIITAKLKNNDFVMTLGILDV